VSWRDLPGYFNFEDLYSEMVRTAPPDSILIEVGVAFGRSLAYLAREAINAKKNLKVYAVDSWETNFDWWAEGPCRDSLIKYGGAFSAFLGGMRQYAYDELEFVRIVRHNSWEAARLFEDYSCHAVFIDADHQFGAVKRDLEAWKEKVQPRGYFAGHDIDQPGVNMACHLVLGPYGFKVRKSRETLGDLVAPGAGDCWIRT